jgi:hypothetical protein
MNKTLLVLVACFVVCVGFAIAHSMAGGQTVYSGATTVSPAIGPAAAPQSGRIQWEYQVMQAPAGDLSLEQLNQMGNDGWEMCGVRQRGQGVSFFYFKREKLEQPGAGAHPQTFPSSSSAPTSWGVSSETFRTKEPTPAPLEESTRSVLKSPESK